MAKTLRPVPGVTLELARWARCAVQKVDVEVDVFEFEALTPRQCRKVAAALCALADRAEATAQKRKAKRGGA